MSLRLKIILRRILFFGISLLGSAGILGIFLITAGAPEFLLLLPVGAVLYLGLAAYSIFRVRSTERAWDEKWKQFESQGISFWKQLLSEPPRRGSLDTQKEYLDIYDKIPRGPPLNLPKCHSKPSNVTMPCGNTDARTLKAVASVIMLEKIKDVRIENCLPGIFRTYLGDPFLIVRVPIVENNGLSMCVWASCTCLKFDGTATVTIQANPSFFMKKGDRLDDGSWYPCDTTQMAKAHMPFFPAALPFTWLVMVPAFLMSILKNWPFSTYWLRSNMPLYGGRSIDWGFSDYHFPLRRAAVELQNDLIPIQKLLESRMTVALSEIAQVFKSMH